MQLVERMTGSPPNCMICGKGNTPDEAGDIGPFLDLQREVNWDDDCYLCEDCGTKVGAMFKMLTADEVQDFHRVIKKLKGQLHDAKSEVERRKAREAAAVRRSRALEEVS